MVLDPTSTKVLVTDANGFIGLQTVLPFIRIGYNAGSNRERCSNTHKLPFMPDMINPKPKDSATDSTDNHGFVN